MTLPTVRVAVPVPLHQLFTYLVPEGINPRPGCRVLVGFGPRKLVGLVVDGPLDEPPSDVPLDKLRPLERLLDESPVLSDTLRELCGWLAGYYHVSPGEAYLLPLPPAMSGGRSGSPRTHSWKHELWAHPVAGAEVEGRLGTKMTQALQWLQEHGSASLAAVGEGCGAGRPVLQRLATRGLVQLEERRVHRDPFRREEVSRDTPPPLTLAQEEAVAAVSAGLDRFGRFLLLGVTGSGKTEVYLHLITQVLDRGQGALVLVPEIALTPQLVSRFRARLGTGVAVLHSGLDAAARHEQWLRIASGELSVVIGARSAVFAPLDNLGLIVVDEEHDGSFKQDNSPRYHGRDLALVRGSLEGCPVLLGSATPSLESWSNVQRGRMNLLRLPERVQDRPMPTVDLLDMRKEAPADRERIFSQRLVDALLETVAAGEQAILLMNRRGYAAWLLCRACGESLTCPACSISYTWHRVRNHLECHYCGRIEHLPSVCPRCKDDALQQMGFGTERIENTLRELVPGARVARMDRDTTRGHALTRLLGAFRKRETDILVGTQMVAKGHDFPGVTLVGVLLAETGLRLPDFRAGERTFQLMTQIAGRAGRAELPGRVLVQTYMPEHYALKLARGHSTEAFLDAELGLRQIRLFPPASHLALFRVESVEADRAWETARRLMAQLGSVGEPAGGDLEIQGPRLAPVERIKERWRIQILLRSSSRSTLSHVLSGVMADLAATPVHHKVHVALDVDPHNFL